MTELMETFTKAVNQTPNADEPILMNFLKQNIQINMGCTFHYNTRKAKRLPTDRQLLEIQTNQVLPNLIDMWHTLKPEAQRYWRTILNQAGITQPQPRDKSHTRFHRFCAKLQLALGKFQRKLRGAIKRD